VGSLPRSLRLAVLVGKYDQSDDESRIILEQAFQFASRLGAVVISRQTDVEIKEAMSKSGGEGFELFHKVCQREKSKLIVGQTTSADAETGGMSGSGVSKVQSQVRGDIRQFDSLWLGNTLRYQLFDPFLRINGIRGRAKISWGAEESDDIVATSETVANLSQAEIEVTDEGLETLGLRVGLPLQRKKVIEPPALPQPGGRMRTLSAAALHRYDRADLANQTIARTGAARLSQAFIGAFAPVRRLVLESDGPEDLIANIEHFYGEVYSPEQLAPVILEALAAHAANGAVRDAS
jgi:phage gp29-like protein